MKSIALAVVLVFTPIMAVADDIVIVRPGNDDARIVELPGNAYLNTAGRGGVIIQDNRDTKDILLNRFVNPYGNYQRPYAGVPVQEMNAICAGTRSPSELRRCQKDVLDQQRRLMRKYND